MPLQIVPENLWQQNRVFFRTAPCFVVRGSARRELTAIPHETIDCFILRLVVFRSKHNLAPWSFTRCRLLRMLKLSVQLLVCCRPKRCTGANLSRICRWWYFCKRIKFRCLGMFSNEATRLVWNWKNVSKVKRTLSQMFLARDLNRKHLFWAACEIFVAVFSAH